MLNTYYLKKEAKMQNRKKSWPSKDHHPKRETRIFFSFFQVSQKILKYGSIWIQKSETDNNFVTSYATSPPEIPKMEDMNEDTADAIEEAFDSDYDVAQAFRSHIIPKAVLWFTGEVC